MILRAVLIISIASSVFAQERFVVDRVEVRNAHRADPQYLAAETLLHEGTEVSEEDVRAAVRRLTRLPFVFAASLALEPGSNERRRVVVITVTENRRFWFLGDGRFTEFHEPIDLLDYDYPDPSAEWKHAAGGVRWLFGDGGVAHFGMTVLRNRHPIRKNYSAWELGYTRHRLFGTRLFATAIARSPVDSLEEKTFTPEVIVGMPLNADQTVTLELEDTSFRDDRFRIGTETFDRLQKERNIAASWTLDTRNDTYAPMSGAYVRVEPSLWMGDRASFSSARPPLQFQRVAQHIDARVLDLTAERHWPLSDVSSVSAGLLGGWADVRDRQNPRTAASNATWRSTFEVLQGGYARKIRWGHLHFEGRAVLRQASDDARVPEGFTDPSYEASVLWAWRIPRATLRLGVTWQQ